MMMTTTTAKTTSASCASVELLVVGRDLLPSPNLSLFCTSVLPPFLLLFSSRPPLPSNHVGHFCFLSRPLPALPRPCLPTCPLLLLHLLVKQ
eukprot:754462-Hanusia_phi.AAC.4